MNRSVVFVIVVLLVAGLIWASYQIKSPNVITPESPGSPEASNGLAPIDAAKAEKASDFTLQGLNGESVSLNQFQGKNVVLLDFWATWCPPCRAAMPELAELQEKYKEKGLIVISINQQEDKATVQGFVDKTSYKPLVLLDSSGVGDMYGARSIPRLVIIDKEGKIRYAESGFAPGMGENLGKLIEKLL